MMIHDAILRGDLLRRALAERVARLLLIGCLSACGTTDFMFSKTEDDSDSAPDQGLSIGKSVESSERIRLRVVHIPASVRAPRFPWYSSDGDRIIFSGTPADGARSEVFSIREDGSECRCLSCAVAGEIGEPLLKPIPFPDDRRILIRVGEQSPTRASAHAVLECGPRLNECSALVPIVIPPPGAAVLQQSQREFRIAPDGIHVGFTQMRATSTEGGAFVAAVAALEKTESEYRLDDARVVSTRGELKGFTPDGRAVLVAAYATSPYAAANPDVLSVLLDDGRESRVTSYPDFDEPLELSPRGDWYVVGSGRGSGLFETVAQLQRPNFIGKGIEPLVSALFESEREVLLEPWLVRRGSEARGARGRRLNPDSAADGYEGRAIANWHPDGTRVLFWEQSIEPAPPNAGSTRVVVVDLLDRAPQREVPSRPFVAPAWAPPLADFVPVEPPTMASRNGKSSGSVLIVEQPVLERRQLVVTYSDFSDDGRWILDGTETALYRGGLTGFTRYSAALGLRGEHTGSLTADALISPLGIEGTIDSTLDGETLHLPR